jgi:hypothetical protein
MNFPQHAMPFDSGPDPCDEPLNYDIDRRGRIICLASDLPAAVCTCPRCVDRRDQAAASDEESATD